MTQIRATDSANWHSMTTWAVLIRVKIYQLAAVVMLLSLLTNSKCRATPPSIGAERLADLPNSLGVAGPFVGVAGDALIVAGGTNFPDAPPWKNGTKTWHDAVYVLPSPEGKWRQGYKLPRSIAYGVSLTTDVGLLCIGGCNEERNLADVFVLQWDGKAVTHRPMPSLPQPTSCAAGALIGSRVYVAGGQPGPDPMAGPSHSHFWMLDLHNEAPTWHVLTTWPGPERFYATAGSDGKSFFLFSGIRRTQDEHGQPVLEYLKDAYCFDPAAGSWNRLADLPHANAAVASPAPHVDGGILLLGRGADGTGISLPLDDRAPFGREALRYDLSSGRWKSLGLLPFGLAAVASTQWHGQTIIASGESRPGVRSPAVWSISPKSLTGDGLPVSQ